MSEIIRAKHHYDNFSKVYDLLSSKYYYHKARNFAVKELELKSEQTILNIPCGTGQNLEYFQEYLKNAGLIIGIDLSTGMLEKAKNKCIRNQWTNIKLYNANALEIDKNWVEKNIKSESSLEIDAILSDLGLSGFPEWEKIIDNLLSILKPGGKIVIMDWYLEKPILRGEFIKWIGKGEINRPIWQFLKTRVDNFRLNHTFNRNGVFVASGNKK